jgi:hypothetical protein
MLDRLPPELLLRVLELAAPLDYTPTFYLERRALLRSCCLVSQTLRDLAQPMLPDVYLAESKGQVEYLKSVEDEAWAGSIRLLVVNGHAGPRLPEKPGRTYLGIRGLFRRLPRLLELRLLEVEEVDLHELAPLAGTQVLTPREQLNGTETRNSRRLEEPRHHRALFDCLLFLDPSLPLSP